MTSKYLLTALGLSLAIAGCGTQPSSSSSMSSTSSASQSMSSTPSSSTASSSTNKMTLANGVFSPTKLTIPTGKSLTLVFNGMGSDHLEIVQNGHVVAHSPLLNKGGTWHYTFQSKGTFTVEPQTMTYIHGTVTVK